MILAINKRAKSEYAITKTLQAGVVLTGSEVKSLRNKHASFLGSYVRIIGAEAFLLNAQINPYKFSNDPDYDPKRTRKLLLKKREIEELVMVSDQKGWAVVPLSFELLHNKIKLKIGVGKGKKVYEKREDIKKRDLERETAREMKYRR